ncbi:MBL fold metallo-hydrolase [Flavobacterium oreochromis]|uniref:MBL fold metallo-hydrolase n=2 Tax=Flavobacterium TaxID=237 RepID=A0A246GBI1_9FLAO|nr:MBL fold metallo-hydrolase [Flavobacterium oreochromis]OWP76619.1 MBL fold metallo-hydrolase [Flavobacterium oreochromis]OWP77987.1 MBL fold metallo-hydrolase [Flavobacterium oreochromis]POR25883.1 MBL fold metallo-hydrolase [Flavobacterium columnare]QYS85707.1 MBL fold metallo-hydrolase [Flavobacterium oreochromis]
MMKKIANEVFHIPLLPRNSVNCYIIEGILIDAGIRSSFSKIKKAIQEVPVHAHAITHAHPDHQGASKLICQNFNLPLYCHNQEVERAESGFATKDYPYPKNLISLFQQKFWAGKGMKVTKTLKEGDFLGDFKVIETPGHSDGHIAFFREKDGVLIAGDIATNMNLMTTKKGLHLPPSLFTSKPKENFNSLIKIAELSPRILCFGHGSVLYNKDKEFENFVSKELKKHF